MLSIFLTMLVVVSGKYTTLNVECSYTGMHHTFRSGVPES